jgi:hypothetical protein
VGWWLLIAYGLCLFVPWSPALITNYYEYAMHLAFSQGLQFGTDILATYGPLGFIGLPLYQESTYVTMVAANVALYAVGVVVLCGLWRDVLEGRAPATWIVAILVLPGFVVNYWAASLSMPFVLVNVLVLRHFLAPSERRRAEEAELSAVLAPFVFVKIVAMPLIALGIAIVACDDVLTRKRISPVLPAVVVAAVAAWLLAGQHVGHLPAYFVGSIDVGIGHREGMSIGGRRSQVVASCFAVTALWLIAYYYWQLSRTELGRRSLWLVLVFGATLFVVFQHGFGRAGEEHMLGASLQLASLALLLAPIFWRLSPSPMKSMFWPATSAFMVVGVAALCIALGAPPLLGAVYKGPRGLWTLLTEGTAPLQAAQRVRFDRLRERTLLPSLKQPVEVSRVDYGLGPAYGFRAVMLPTITGYTSNTARMARRNREFVENPAGPATMLFAPDAIDLKYPTASDSLLRLVLRSHFDVTRNTGAFLIMERRATPRRLALMSLGVRDVAWSETVLVPEHEGDAVWAQIDVRPSVMGWMVGTAYKPAPVWLTVNTPDASTFRLTTDTAREGFILTPVLRDLAALNAFYRGAAGPGESVVSIQLNAEGSGWFYRDRITISFFRLVVTDALQSVLR